MGVNLLIGLGCHSVRTHQKTKRMQKNIGDWTHATEIHGQLKHQTLFTYFDGFDNYATWFEKFVEHKSTCERGFQKRKRRFLPEIESASSVVDDPIPYHQTVRAVRADWPIINSSHFLKKNFKIHRNENGTSGTSRRPEESQQNLDPWALQFSDLFMIMHYWFLPYIFLFVL
jgi:hypothetical protein